MFYKETASGSFVAHPAELSIVYNRGDPMADAKKTQKRKREDTESESQSKDAIQQPVAKKRKNRTNFADPRGDSTLGSQSRKGSCYSVKHLPKPTKCHSALEYAFMQMNKPSKWKFNKARQNWIIRNLWAPVEVRGSTYP